MSFCEKERGEVLDRMRETFVTDYVLRYKSRHPGRQLSSAVIQCISLCVFVGVLACGCVFLCVRAGVLASCLQNPITKTVFPWKLVWEWQHTRMNFIIEVGRLWPGVAWNQQSFRAMELSSCFSLHLLSSECLLQCLAGIKWQWMKVEIKDVFDWPLSSSDSSANVQGQSFPLNWFN